MNFEHILAIDPSGNFREGKGTTGYCKMYNGRILDVGEIKAEGFPTAAEYWFSHKFMINTFMPDVVVCESYQLYHHKGKKAETQAHSYLETPQLIGVITVACWEKDVPLIFQTASQVKTRWPEDLLVQEGFITKEGRSYFWNGKKLSRHEIDAIRHAVHYSKYGKKAYAV